MQPVLPLPLAKVPAPQVEHDVRPLDDVYFPGPHWGHEQALEKLAFESDGESFSHAFILQKMQRDLRPSMQLPKDLALHRSLFPFQIERVEFESPPASLGT